MATLTASAEFTSWIDAFRDKSTSDRIVARLVRLTLGNFGDARPVGGGVHELRIHLGPGYRVYFLPRGTEIVVLLCGGDKSTQAKDIVRARQIAIRWKE